MLNPPLEALTSPPTFILPPPFTTSRLGSGTLTSPETVSVWLRPIFKLPSELELARRPPTLTLPRLSAVLEMALGRVKGAPTVPPLAPLRNNGAVPVTCLRRHSDESSTVTSAPCTATVVKTRKRFWLPLSVLVRYKLAVAVAASVPPPCNASLAGSKPAALLPN